MHGHRKHNKRNQLFRSYREQTRQTSCFLDRNNIFFDTSVFGICCFCFHCLCYKVLWKTKSSRNAGTYYSCLIDIYVRDLNFEKGLSLLLRQNGISAHIAIESRDDSNSHCVLLYIDRILFFSDCGIAVLSFYVNVILM